MYEDLLNQQNENSTAKHKKVSPENSSHNLLNVPTAGSPSKLGGRKQSSSPFALGASSRNLLQAENAPIVKGGGDIGNGKEKISVPKAHLVDLHKLEEATKKEILKKFEGLKK